MKLTPEEAARYSRHLILPEIGEEGQAKIKASGVLVMGAGGLGSPAALYLAAAGVGRIGLADADSVDASNLQRQVLHDSGWLGKPKVDSGAARLKALNPHVQVRVYRERITRRNALEIFGEYDLIADATDNFPCRYLSCDASFLLKKPLVYGAVYQFEGQATFFEPGGRPCYRCLYPVPPAADLVPKASASGILGVVPGIIGLVQATEALKRLVGIGQSLAGRLLLYDALNMKFRELNIRPDPECPLCGGKPGIKELIDYEAFCAENRGKE